MSTFYRAKEKLFQLVQSGPWQVMTPVPVVESASTHRWEGEKIPLEMFYQGVAFFEWALKENPNDEAIVQYFYNEDTKEWKIIAPLQEGKGLHVKLLGTERSSQYYDRREALLAQHCPIGQWALLATDHHHVRAGAFQSGTDSADENFGLHITHGHMDKEEYDLHSRVVFRNVQTDACLADWFDVPQVKGLPAKFVEPIVAHYLKQHAPAGTTFPEWWKESIIKSPPTPVTTWSYGGWQHDKELFHSMPAAPQAPQNSNRRSYFKFEEDLENLAKEWNVSGKQLAEHIRSIVEEDPVIEELINVIADHDATFDEAIGALSIMDQQSPGISGPEQGTWRCTSCYETIFNDTQAADGLCDDCRDYRAAGLNDI